MLRSFLILFLAILGVVFGTTFEWQSVEINGGGFVPGIIFHPASPGLLYARTDVGGLYRWDEETKRWKQLFDFLRRDQSDYMGVLSIALDPSDPKRIYAMTGKYTQDWAGYGAILISEDYGETWTIVNLDKYGIKVGGNEDGRNAGERLQVDPNFSSVLFMGTTKYGLWKSEDFGKNWKKVDSFPSTSVTFVLFDEKSGKTGSPTPRIFVGCSEPKGIFVTEDGGTTWNVLPNLPSDLIPLRGKIHDGILYVTFSNALGPNGATKGAVMKYMIADQKWYDVTPMKGDFGYCGIDVQENVVIVSTLDRWYPHDEIFISLNGGETWRPLLEKANFDISKAPWIKDLNPHWISDVKIDPFDMNRAIFTTGYGVWVTYELKKSFEGMGKPVKWIFENRGLEETVVLQLVPPIGERPLLSAIADWGGFRHERLDTPPSSMYKPLKWTSLGIAFAYQNSKFVARVHTYTYPFLSYSEDGGVNWREIETVPEGITDGGRLSLAVSNDGKTLVWSPANHEVIVSNDKGKSWKKVIGVPVPEFNYFPASDPVNPSKFYIFDWKNGDFLISEDRGKSFMKGAKLPSFDNWWVSLYSFPVLAPDREGDIWLALQWNGLYRSKDGGITFERLGNVDIAYVIGFGAPKPGTDYPAIYLNGVVNGVYGIFMSTDEGKTWMRINDDKHQFGWIHYMIGDMNEFGRIFLGTEGRGIIIGEVKEE